MKALHNYTYRGIQYRVGAERGGSRSWSIKVEAYRSIEGVAANSGGIKSFRAACEAATAAIDTWLAATALKPSVQVVPVSALCHEPNCLIEAGLRAERKPDAMRWMTIEITLRMSLVGEEARILNACQGPWTAALCPKEACLLVSQGDHNLVTNRFLVFSPLMASICAAILSQYNAAPCPIPDFHKMTVLLANGSPGHIFAPGLG